MQVGRQECNAGMECMHVGMRIMSVGSGRKVYWKLGSGT